MLVKRGPVCRSTRIARMTHEGREYLQFSRLQNDSLHDVVSKGARSSEDRARREMRLILLLGFKLEYNSLRRHCGFEARRESVEIYGTT